MHDKKQECNLVFRQLFLCSFPLLDTVGDVNGDRLGAEVPTTDVARHRHDAAWGSETSNLEAILRAGG